MVQTVKESVRIKGSRAHLHILRECKSHNSVGESSPRKAGLNSSHVLSTVSPVSSTRRSPRVCIPFGMAMPATMEVMVPCNCIPIVVMVVTCAIELLGYRKLGCRYTVQRGRLTNE